MRRKGIYGLFLCFIFSVNSYTQSIFTGSTPADAPVRTFLKIDEQIAIDFIRWQLNLEPSGKYLININYGEGQPNTMGFKNGGKFVELSGEYKTTSGNDLKITTLTGSGAGLAFVHLNDNLLHMLSSANKLMRGNGGWSYTLSKKDPVDQRSSLPVFKKNVSLREKEMIFEGRSPCQELAKAYNITNAERECFKLKWLLTLKRDKNSHQPSTYTLSRTLERSRILEGKWKLITGENGAKIIELLTEKGDVSVVLLAADEDVLFFLDKQHKLFTGNKDFSYTLNRRR